MSLGCRHISGLGRPSLADDVAPRCTKLGGCEAIVALGSEGHSFQVLLEIPNAH